MNEYTVNYRFLFKDLKFPFTTRLLFEQKAPIVYRNNLYTDLEAKYIIHFPKINIMKIDGNFDERQEYIDKLKEEYKKTKEDISLEYKYDFIQEISVVIHTEEDLEFDDHLKKAISDDVSEYLNTYLSMIKHELFLWEWQLPKFHGSHSGTIGVRNKLFEYLDSASYYKNGELISEPFGFNINFASDLERFLNLDDVLEKIRDRFQEGNHDIPQEKEIICLSYYEMKGGNFDVALLLATIAVELPIKNMVHMYFDRHKVCKIIDDMKRNPKMRDKPTIIKYWGILTEKYPFIRHMGIDIDKIETLIRARNKIAHEGEPYYFSKDGQMKIYVDYRETLRFVEMVKDFTEVKIPLIKEKIESKMDKQIKL